jgi:hypothetical protein
VTVRTSAGLCHTRGSLVAVAQLAERRDVAPEVAGSSPVGHPLTLGKVRVLRADPRLSCSEGASSSMAEQRTLNPQVLGSNPRGRTTTPGQGGT